MREKIIKVCSILLEWCLYLIFFCIPFAKAGIEIFFLVAITAWIIKKLTSYKLQVTSYFTATGLNNILGWFVIINVLTIITSVNFILSIKGFLGKIVEYVMLYFIVVEVINNKKRMRNMLIVILISAVFMIMDSFVQYFSGYDFLRHYSKEGYYLKASFSSHNGFGGWLVVLIPLFLCLPFWTGLKTMYQRIGLGIVGILLLICLFATYSRGAWLGLFLGLGFILFYSTLKIKKIKYKILIIIFLLVSLIGLFFIVPFTIKERLASIPNVQEGYGLNRINAWQEAFNIIEDYPLFGSGLNTYSFIGRRYKIFEGGGIYPHNSFLHMAAETGVVGLICFIWLLIELFKSGIRFLKNHPGPLVLGLLAGILAFLVHGFFDNNLYSLQLAALFWFMLGLTVSTQRIIQGF